MNDDRLLTDDLIGRMLQRRSARGNAFGLDSEIAAALDGTRQRWRNWRRPASWLDNRELRLVGMVTGAIALVGLVSMMAIGIGRMPPDFGNGASSPTPSEAASPLPSDGGTATLRPLSAGTHTTGFFWPRLTFSVPSGFLSDGDSPRFFGLVPGTSGGAQGQTFLNVFRDLSVASGDCREAPDAGVGNTAGEIVGALAARAGLAVSEPRSVNVGDLSGEQVDIALASGWNSGCPGATGPFAPLLYEAGLLWWGAGPGERFRLIVLDIPGDGGTVSILVYASDEAAWADHEPGWMDIVGSFELDASGRPSTESPQRCGNGARTCAGALDAGEHHTIAFEPAFTYETPAGWANPIDIEGVFEIFPDIPMLTLNPYVEVLSHASIVAQDAGCPTGPDDSRGTGVQDWIDYLVTHPGLDASAPMPVSIGGADGQSIDLRISPDAGALCPAFPPGSNGLFFIWSNDLGQPAQFGIDPGRRMRLAIIDVRGTTVLIAMYGPAASTSEDFARALSEMRPFIDSIEFDSAS
jgi:hypothetical protein